MHRENDADSGSREVISVQSDLIGPEGGEERRGSVIRVELSVHMRDC